MTTGVTYRRNPDLPATVVDDELLVLNADSTRYSVLDPVGRRIWELLETPRSAAHLCQMLAREYDAPPTRIAADVSAFLGQLVERQIVVIVAEDGADHARG